MLVVLTARADVVAPREAKRAKVDHRGSASIEQIDRALRQDTPRTGLSLDNSDQQPDETVEEIIERGLVAGPID